MSRFALVCVLALSFALGGCLTPPGATVAAPGPEEFLIEGQATSGGQVFAIENRLGEQAPRCPGCLRWCAEDGLQSRPWDPDLPTDCSELAFLVDFVQRDGAGNVTANAGLGVGIGFAEIDGGVELLTFDFSAVPAKDIAPGNDGWRSAGVGDFFGDPDGFFVNSFALDNGNVSLCWTTPHVDGTFPEEGACGD